MKKVGLVLAVLTMLSVCLVPVPAAASDTETIAVTATGGFEDISITGGGWDIQSGSTVSTSTSYYSNPLGETTSPSATVVDGECQHTVTNDGSVQVDCTIRWPDMTGGVGWTNSDDGTNGSDIFGAYGCASGELWANKVVAKDAATYNEMISNLAASGTKKFVMEFYSPSAFTDGDQKSCNVEIIATQG